MKIMQSLILVLSTVILNYFSILNMWTYIVQTEKLKKSTKKTHHELRRFTSYSRNFTCIQHNR